MKICLAIGVAHAEGTTPLPGAHRAARGLGDWATAQGYSTVVLTDEPDRAGRPSPVTIETIRSALLPLVGDRSVVVDRIIISFAGHGAIRGAGDEYWLLNGWRNGDEAINVGLLKSRLRTYGVRQISIFSDACRLLIKSDQLQLNGSAVLPASEFRSPRIQIDSIHAAQAGEAAYAVDDSCFMSAVLVHALWGQFEEAIDRDRNGHPVVTSDSLMDTVETRLSDLAALFDEDQDPECQAQFRRPLDAIYTRLQGAEPPQLPTLPAPRPRIVPAAKVQYRRKAAAPPTAGATIGYTIPDMPREPRQRPPASPLSRQRARFTADSSGLSGRDAPDVLVTGASAVRGMATEGARLELMDGDWRVRDAVDGSAFLLQLEDGRWTGAALYSGLGLSISVAPEGVVGLLYAPRDHTLASAPSPRAIDAVARLGTGTLSLRQAVDYALVLRRDKHRDPVLGVLAAYLYARIDDIESVRSLAWWYVHYGQPIPFDIALLADVDLVLDGARFVASIPETDEIVPRTARERRSPAMLQPREACRGPVAGRFPWLREGWRLVGDSPIAAIAELEGYAAGLSPAPFTTLDRDAGQALADRMMGGRG